MRRRFAVLIGWLLAIGVGVGLAAGPFPDMVEDLVQKLQIAWFNYQLTSSSASVVLLMVSGFLLGQGLFLSVRRLWSGTLLSFRERLAEVDLGHDPGTAVFSKFALRRFMRRTLAWAKTNPSASHIAVALIKIRGLDRLDDTEGVLRIADLIRTMSHRVRDAAISRRSTGLRRIWHNQTMRAARFVRIGKLPSRCPARWSDTTFALAMRGMDARDVFLYSRDLMRELADVAQDANARVPLTVVGSVVIRWPNAAWPQIARAAMIGLDQAHEAEEMVVVHRNDAGTQALLTEFADLPNMVAPSDGVPDDHERDEVITAREVNSSMGTRGVRWLRAWGLAAACFAAIPLLLILGRSDREIVPLKPWPETLTALPVMSDSGMNAIPLVRHVARPYSDGRWTISDTVLTQPAKAPTGANAVWARVKLTITNRDSSNHHINMLDLWAIDDQGHRLPVNRNSLRFENPLDTLDLGPGQSWTGWLQFRWRDAPVTALLVHPSRDHQMLLRFETAQKKQPK